MYLHTHTHTHTLTHPHPHTHTHTLTLTPTQKQSKKRKTTGEVSFSALHLINDPQDFAEKLFDRLKQIREKFEIRLMMMSLISRLIGLHQVRVAKNLYIYISFFFALQVFQQ